MNEELIDWATSKGIYSDFWLDRTANLALMIPEGHFINVEFWVPDFTRGKGILSQTSRIIWRVGTDEHRCDAQPGEIIAATVFGGEAFRPTSLWLGCRTWDIIYDVGEERYGRRVALKIHQLSCLKI
jgi:hypothetical protein